MKPNDRDDRTGRWARGTSGNPAGRPPGSRNKTTEAVQQIIEGNAELLTLKLVELALNGNIAAMRLCMERASPPRKDRQVQLDLPPARTAEEVSATLAAITKAISEGQITPGEGHDLANILAMQQTAISIADVRGAWSSWQRQSGSITTGRRRNENTQKPHSRDGTSRKAGRKR